MIDVVYISSDNYSMIEVLDVSYRIYSKIEIVDVANERYSILEGRCIGDFVQRRFWDRNVGYLGCGIVVNCIRWKKWLYTMEDDLWYKDKGVLVSRSDHLW